MFISKERKIAGIKGLGIQYIPGHVEPFIDLIIKDHMPDKGGIILDLGGGGLRFAIPVALTNRKITVVDLDPSGLDIDIIYSKVLANDKEQIPDAEILKKNISVEIISVFDYLKSSKQTYSLITSFRLIHFLSEIEVEFFFTLISSLIAPNGKLAISSFSCFNEDNRTYNEIYKNSSPIANNSLYRKFLNNVIAANLQKEQNLKSEICILTKEYLTSVAKRNNLKMIIGDCPSTRTVRGYIFIKE